MFYRPWVALVLCMSLVSSAFAPAFAARELNPLSAQALAQLKKDREKREARATARAHRLNEPETQVLQSLEKTNQYFVDAETAAIPENQLAVAQLAPEFSHYQELEYPAAMTVYAMKLFELLASQPQSETAAAFEQPRPGTGQPAFRGAAVQRTIERRLLDPQVQLKMAQILNLAHYTVLKAVSDESMEALPKKEQTRAALKAGGAYAGAIAVGVSSTFALIMTHAIPISNLALSVVIHLLPFAGGIGFGFKAADKIYTHARTTRLSQILWGAFIEELTDRLTLAGVDPSVITKISDAFTSGDHEQIRAELCALSLKPQVRVEVASDAQGAISQPAVAAQDDDATATPTAAQASRN